jgi:hypothetical protein
MPTVSPAGFRYFRELYTRGQLTITNAEVVVSGLRISASASILSVSTAAESGYEDLIVDFVVTFNTSVAGTLQEISITVSGPSLKGVTPTIHFCSSEDLTVPAGTVRVTKRFIVRWYTRT